MYITVLHNTITLRNSSEREESLNTPVHSQVVHVSLVVSHVSLLLWLLLLLTSEMKR